MRFLVLIALLAGCGVDPSKTGTAPVSPETASTAAADPKAVPETPPASADAPEAIYAVSLNNVKELPECTSKSLKQLAYVKEESHFYSCEATGWAELTIGSKGDKGDTGSVGPAGSVGATGPAGAPLNSNEWLDVMTGFTWMIGGGVHFVTAQQTCSGGWRMPTSNEATAAYAHGIGSRGANDIWTSDANPTAGQAYVVNSSGLTSQVIGSTYGVGCIKN